ncbi:hypothetical protein M0R36_10985 [bacterium]|jgi:hypothetical protein|nr:hypothetical protein [bacterium]
MNEVKELKDIYKDYKLIVVYDANSKNPTYTGDGCADSMILELSDGLKNNKEFPIIITLNSQYLVEYFRIAVIRKLINHQNIVLHHQEKYASMFVDCHGDLSDYMMDAHENELMEILQWRYAHRDNEIRKV